MSLSDYFQQQGQALPSLAERRSTYGLGSSYVGSAEQNAQLLAKLQGGGATPAPASAQPSAQPAQGGSLWSQYSQRLAPITQKSDQLLKDYYELAAQAPSFAQRLLDSVKQAGQYPSHAALREKYSQNENLTPMAIESMVSREGQATRGTIGDVMGRAQGGLDSDIASRQGAAQMAQQERGNLLEEYGFARQEQQDILAQQKSSRGSESLQQKNVLEANVLANIQGGMTAEDMANLYGGQMDDWELIDLYNKNSPHGPMDENPAQFKKWTGDVEPPSEGIEPSIVEEDFNLFKNAHENIDEAKNAFLQFVQTNDPDNYERVKQYMDLNYPSIQANSNTSSGFSEPSNELKKSLLRMG